MKCQWSEMLSILPLWIRREVDNQGREGLQELRLRLGLAPEMVFKSGFISIGQAVTSQELRHVINMACRYSPWTATSISQGYLTAPGGHRIGICGQLRTNEQGLPTMQEIRSLCIRVARDFPGIAADLGRVQGSILIIGSPGTGKTTLLRDLIRQRSKVGSISVVDERGELFPPGGFEAGIRTDVLSFAPKEMGIDMVLRAMGPSTIAVDEITSRGDCLALQRAAWCGVDLLATAHAHSKEDLYRREVYKPLISSGIFRTLVILSRDQSWRMERISQ